MNNLSTAEKRVLDIMKKENFRGISKDNVMQFASIIDKVDPEVAKALIAQMPEAVRGMIEMEKSFAGVVTKGIESCDMSINSCFQTEDDIIKSLQKEIDKDETTFEEKQYYFEKMEEAVKRKESKDTEHKETILTIMKYGSEALVMGLLCVSCLFLRNADIKLPFKTSM